MFDKEAEIWHIYSPHILGVACKILGKSDEALAVALPNVQRSLKMHNFGFFFSRLFPDLPSFFFFFLLETGLLGLV